jgi:hypothetical protein
MDNKTDPGQHRDPGVAGTAEGLVRDNRHLLVRRSDNRWWRSRQRDKGGAVGRLPEKVGFQVHPPLEEQRGDAGEGGKLN